MSFDDNFDGEASRTIYIVALIVALLVNEIITGTINPILFDFFVQQKSLLKLLPGDDFITQLLLFTTVVNTIVSAGVFVTIYSFFNKIIIRKVIIWLWILELIFTIINTAMFFQYHYFVDKNSPILDVIIPYNVIGFIVTILLFIQYFKWNDRLVDVNIIGWSNNNNEHYASKEIITNIKKNSSSKTNSTPK